MRTVARRAAKRFWLHTTPRPDGSVTYTIVLKRDRNKIGTTQVFPGAWITAQFGFPQHQMYDVMACFFKLLEQPWERTYHVI